MNIKPKYLRLLIILAALASLLIGVFAVMYALRDNIIFFYTPTEIVSGKGADQKTVRIGGLVKEKSLIYFENCIEFRVTDLVNEVLTKYCGTLPDLFREKQGTVAKGIYKDRVFYATELLTKHDENYMPKEVIDTLKAGGNWEYKQ